jgi:hypothetical protein
MESKYASRIMWYVALGLVTVAVVWIRAPIFGSRIFLCCRFLRSGVTPLDATRAIFTKGSSEKYHVIWNAITDFVDFRYFWWSLPERVIRILRESDGRRSWNRSDVGRNRRRAPITRSSYRQANLSGRSGES